MRTKTVVLLAVLALGLCFFPVSSFAVFEELVNHPARAPEPYKEWAGKPPCERIAPAPEILVDYLKLDNKLNGYPEVPATAKPDQALLADFQQAVKELPEPVQAQLSKHLAGIFTVRDLGTTGLTEVLTIPENEQMGFIVIDVDHINQPANEWAAMRANSPFAPDGKTEIRAIVETPENNNRKQAIQNILIHEIGHLVGAAVKAHPSWNKEAPPEDFSFSRISWRSADGKTVSKFDDIFPMRAKIRFYSLADSSVSASQIPECYAQLEQTDFTSLYGARNVWSDFASAYTVYVHTVLQNKPWIMEIYTDGKKVGGFTSPLLKEQGKAKKDYLDALFQ
ncbi:MAG: hypothetical protein JEZ02_20985 [Desulfatibacillum sp.]|nr:hypothetical protein [Desulfatibacillum sp.]